MRMTGRYFHTLRHLRPVQVTDRLRRRLLPTRPRTAHCESLRPVAGWQQPVARRPHLDEGGVFHLHGRSAQLFDGEIWHDHSLSRLWLYHAHYHDDLAAPDVPAPLQARLIDDWLAHNPAGEGPGWEPYPVSRRIVNWLKWHLAGNDLSESARESLATQADFLARDLEFHLLGNHLLANLKALLFAGCLLQSRDSRRWLARAEDLLARQLGEQVLDDGGHHELSCMYHAVVLEDLLDLVNLGRSVRPPLAARLTGVCERMLEWLRVMTHPDGDIAFFNDAAFDGCARPSALFDYALRLGIDAPRQEAQRCILLADSGYGRLAAGRLLVLLDAADIGPEHLPGHAHADTLSFELSVDTRRVIVNSGTSTYERGAERARQRSTAAHSTVAINGRSSSDVWDSFRTGQRARIIRRRQGCTAGANWIAAAHDGYRHIAGVIHERRWLVKDGELVLRDRIDGRTRQMIEWYLHVHPDFEPRPVGRGSWRIDLGDGSSLDIIGGPELPLCRERSSYHPEFGFSKANWRLSARISAYLPCEIDVRMRTV